jgi:16S rRNA (cytosine1402-N4)-methyltransferase
MDNVTTASPSGHIPVLLDEAVAALQPRAGGVYVDGTFGGGGHARAILERAPQARVIAIDRDAEAVERGRELQAEVGEKRLQLVHGNFADLQELLAERGVPAVDGVLLDLGLSSYQLDDPERGFAFRFDGPLDMRMDPTSGVPASDLANRLDERALADLLWRYGDERRSRQIAAAIERERSREPITTTARLASIVEKAVGGRRGAPVHPATKSFMALRIAVNDELAALERGLAAAVAALRPGGRLAVISFHSLEDRLVKRFMRDQAADCVCPPGQPVCTCGTTPTIRIVGKPVRPSQYEAEANARSRSATLRVAERLSPEGTSP